MSNIITIGFDQDTGTYELPKSIVSKYPDSILSLYETSGSNEPIIITDMTYEQFGIIYDVITGKKKQWMVDPYILNLMDKYGLVNDILLALHLNINKKINEEFMKMENFLNNGKMLLPDNMQQYEEYKKLFENNKNIMSIQMTFDYYGLIICINLLESIPIYYNHDGSNPKYVLENMDICESNEMDINLLRYHIIVRNLGCENCIMCDKCNNALHLHEGCCRPCGKCWNCKDKIPMDKNIYTKDKKNYFDCVHRLLTNDSDLDLYQKKKSSHANIIKWNEVTSTHFTNNIHNSLKLLKEFIIENNYDIFNHYRSQKLEFFNTKGSDYSDNNTMKTYYVFINIEHILQ
jgi:hypothetical protein